MAAELAASAAELAAREQSARTHRALQTDDVLACVFSRLALRDGCVVAASVCKQWRGAWRGHAKGLYKPVRLGIGEFRYGDHLTALAGGGVIVPDYRENCLHVFTEEGEHRGLVNSEFDCPTAVALDDKGVSWVILHDDCALSRRPINYETMQPRVPGSSELELAGRRLMDLSISGTAVLVLFQDAIWRYGQVLVLDRNTGAERYRFGSGAKPGGVDAGGVDELRGPSGLAIEGDYCFVADTYNQSIAVFNWFNGQFVRRYGKTGGAPEFDDDSDNYWEEFDDGPTGTYDDDRKSAAPGQFNEPYDVAIRNKLLYVAEKGGRRIQVLRLPDDISGADPELIQIIPSPGGVELAGLCLDGDRLWCMGPPIPGGTAAGDDGHASISIFAPIV